MVPHLFKSKSLSLSGSVSKSKDHGARPGRMKYWAFPLGCGFCAKKYTKTSGRIDPDPDFDPDFDFDPDGCNSGRNSWRKYLIEIEIVDHGLTWHSDTKN